MVSWLLGHTRQNRFVFSEFICDIYVCFRMFEFMCVFECFCTLPYASCLACRGQHRWWVQPADSGQQLDQQTPHLQKQRWFRALNKVMVCSPVKTLNDTITVHFQCDNVPIEDCQQLGDYGNLWEYSSALFSTSQNISFYLLVDV